MGSRTLFRSGPLDRLMLRYLTPRTGNVKDNSRGFFQAIRNQFPAGVPAGRKSLRKFP